MSRINYGIYNFRKREWRIKGGLTSEEAHDWIDGGGMLGGPFPKNGDTVVAHYDGAWQSLASHGPVPAEHQ